MAKSLEPLPFFAWLYKITVRKSKRTSLAPSSPSRHACRQLSRMQWHWMPTPKLYGKTTDQGKALIGDAAVRIADLAKASSKPIVIENLDFSKKKAEREATHKPLARMLSSFARNKVISSIKAAALRRGIEVIEVNPAYTSVIGAPNHAQVKGISVHMGATLAIARRGLGLCEKPPKQEAIAPARNGGQVTFCAPARMRAEACVVALGGRSEQP